MQVLQHVIMQNIVKILAPSSPAYGNAMQTFYKNQQQKESEFVVKLQPFDIIFTRTDTLIYNSSRSFLGIQYDHVAVVINKEEVLHISPPITSKIPIKCLVVKGRSPLIIRPSLKQNEKQQFLKHLLNLLGTSYSVLSIPKMFMNQLQNLMNLPQKIQFKIQNLKQSKICSDAIIYALCVSSASFKKQLQKRHSQTSYSELGFILPDCFLNLLQSLYPTIYRASIPSIQKSPLGNLLNKTQPLLNLIKQYNTPFNISLKLLGMVSSKAKGLNNVLGYKDEMFRLLGNIALASNLCQLFGIKKNSKTYRTKLIIMTVFIHLLGSNLLINMGTQKGKNSHYQIPDFNQVEKLFLPKPKI